MVTLGMSEILKLVDAEKKLDKKVEILRKNDSTVLRDILRMPYDPLLKWLLPDGEPPFKKNEQVGQQGNLYSEWKRMYLFFPGNYPPISQNKREMIFVQILETLEEEDAKLLCSIKDHKMPYKGVTQKVAEAAFPGLYDFLRAREKNKVDG